VPAILTANKIIVISTRQIGDVLLTTPLILSLRNQFPHAQIDVLVFNGKASILAGNATINNVIEVPDKPTFYEYYQLLKRIFRHYDYAFVTQSSDRAHLFGLLSAKKRIGLLPTNKSHQWWKKFICTHWQLLDDVNTHTVTQNLLFASCVDIPLRFDVVAPQSEKSADFCQAEFKIDVNKLNYVMIHPYPMWQYKLWTISGWQTLITHLHTLGLHVVVSSGNAVNELAYCNEMTNKFAQGVTLLNGKTSFADAAFLLKHAKAYIGMDTVMTHLAAASGTPTLALFGPTNPIKWAPWPFGYHAQKSPWQHYSAQYQQVNNVLLLQGLDSCVPCHKAGCNDHNNSHSQCLDDLSASRVIDAFDVLINGKSAKKVVPICAS
jgi:heptosyltransferase III